MFAALLLLPAAAHAQIMFGRATAIDGDTLELGGDRIRLHGIDALEASQTCTRNGTVWECGKDASTLLSSLVSGKTVQCQQRDRDAYGRIVAFCRADGVDLGGSMVEAGLAVALPQFSTAYVDTERRMRMHKLGMWDSEFQMPGDYRLANPHLLPSTPKPKFLPAPRALPKPHMTQRPSPQSEGVYFRNCAAARAAGAAPLYQGQRGYRPQLDADNDG
ncbi:MAG: thermonuclease family protein, partial [Novosphingobium sp.]|nr:thermonuclease family protein [Novosphingobium sp.]